MMKRPENVLSRAKTTDPIQAIPPKSGRVSWWSALDRIRIDRTHILGSINPVNPVYINNVEQIHAVDWDRRRRFQSTPICSRCYRRIRISSSSISSAVVMILAAAE